jgi:hypothetical protein
MLTILIFEVDSTVDALQPIVPSDRIEVDIDYPPIDRGE